MYDLLIKGGRVIDGTAGDAFIADVAVKNGFICAVGELGETESAEVVNAAGKCLVPGFIDSHSHADLTLARFPDVESLVAQGVTTVCTGHCSMGMAPISRYYMAGMGDEEAMELLTPPLFSGLPPQTDATVVPANEARKAFSRAYGIALDWSGWGEYIRHLERTGIGVNMMGLVGHAPIRLQVMGQDFRRVASGDEIEQMCGLLRQCMEEGANGLSYGFDYAPGNYADEEELMGLAAVVAEYDGLLAAHVQYSGRRGEHVEPGFQPYQGYREFLEIGLKTGARLQISHVRTAFKPIADCAVEKAACQALIDLIQEYRGKGVRVHWDVLPDYIEAGQFEPMLASRLLPYVEQCGSLSRFRTLLGNDEYVRRLRRELENAGHLERISCIGLSVPGWEDMLVISRCEKREYEGKSIGALARENRMHPVDMLLTVLRADVYTCVKLAMERRIGFDYYIRHPEASVGLDVGGWNYDCNREKRPDMPPCYCGGYADFTGMIYLLERCADMRKETLIAAMTGKTAHNLGLSDRGLIRQGMRADLVLLDWEHLHSNIDRIQPNRMPAGIAAVWINGRLAAENGTLYHPRAGMIIKNKDRKHN